MLHFSKEDAMHLFSQVLVPSLFHSSAPPGDSASNLPQSCVRPWGVKKSWALAMGPVGLWSLAGTGCCRLANGKAFPASSNRSFMALTFAFSFSCLNLERYTKAPSKVEDSKVWSFQSGSPAGVSMPL